MSIIACRACSRAIDLDFDNDVAAEICIDCLRHMSLAELYLLLRKSTDEFDKLLIGEILQEKVTQK